MNMPKPFSPRARLLCVLLVGSASCGIHAPAQTFSVLMSFGSLTNVSGAQPEAQLVQGPDGVLYGTTSSGYGTAGTVFRISTGGSGFATLKRFTNAMEGAEPIAGLALSANTLYGTTLSGGSSNAGTVFKINTDGTGFAVLKHFAGSASEGGHPMAGLTVSGEDLYGTTSARGGNGLGWGGVFRLKTDGTGFTVLKDFIEEGAQPSLVPRGRLTLSGDVLYGTTLGGYLPPSPPAGSVFTIRTDGTGYRILKHGVSPTAGLTLADGVLYGTSQTGGMSNLGTVFQLKTDGTGYGVLKEFTGGDGANPRADLVVSAGVLYGTTSHGGRHGGGILFRLNSDGSGFSVLREVYTGAPDDGSQPNGGLMLSSGVLYGTTSAGGRSAGGTLFTINTDGTGYRLLKDFSAVPGDAIQPEGMLTSSAGHLFGTSSKGGDFGYGTLFRVAPDGTGFTVLKHFRGTAGDGAGPTHTLISSEGMLYGSTHIGSDANPGTVYTMSTDGTGYQVLKEFQRGYGSHTVRGLAMADRTLYGWTRLGGASDAGTLFRMNTNGMGFQVFKEFAVHDGAQPIGSLVVTGGVLYGTTIYGGAFNQGTVFRVNTNGSDFRVLKQFTGAANDGALPAAGVIVSEGVLYGTTGDSGGSGSGTLFRMNTDGTGFIVLRSFGADSSDGRYPGAVLAASSTVLYGVTLFGGSAQKGTLYRILTDGTGYTLLRDFLGADGDGPYGGLMLYEDTLYGTTYWGGALDFGTLFRVELLRHISLTARAQGDDLVLSWNDSKSTLQSAPAVTAVYTSLPSVTSPYTNPISGAQRFFRLIGN